MVGKRNIWLYPLAVLYGLIVRTRNALFDLGILKSHEFPIPIISVGNITVGGTGKTPHVEYLISIIKEVFQVAIISRGYGRKSKGFKEVLVNASYLETGDEPLQIKHKFPDVPVYVDGNRVRAINQLLSSENKPNCIILDDAFQHRYVKPGLSVLLIDYHRLISRDYMLPYGNLREKASNQRKANIIIVTKTPENILPIDKRLIEKEINPLPYQQLYFSKIVYKKPVSLFPKKWPATKFSFTKIKYDVLLVTGIATPQTLLTHLGHFFKHIEHLHYPDHHNFTKKDLQHIHDKFQKFSVSLNKIILTSEKDAIRFLTLSEKENIANLPIFYIPIQIDFLTQTEKENFNKNLINYARKNISISSIHF